MLIDIPGEKQLPKAEKRRGQPRIQRANRQQIEMRMAALDRLVGKQVSRQQAQFGFVRLPGRCRRCGSLLFVQTDNVGDDIRNLLLRQAILGSPGRHKPGWIGACRTRAILEEKIQVICVSSVICTYQG
jgi:hypothetical protein